MSDTASDVWSALWLWPRKVWHSRVALKGLDLRSSLCDPTVYSPVCFWWFRAWIKQNPIVGSDTNPNETAVGT